MDISVLIEDDLAEHVSPSWLHGIAEMVLAAQGVSPDAELDLFITGQEQIQELNRDYRNKDKATDVLAFPMLDSAAAGEATNQPAFITPPDGVTHLGEVIISYPQAVIQAQEHRHRVEFEITVLLIHGILHLLGFDHEVPSAAAAMRARETEILEHIEGRQP